MRIAALSLALLLLTSSAVDAGLYKIRVMWIDTNVYEDLTTGTRIHTSLCLEMPMGDRAVDPPSAIAGGH